MPQLPPGIAAFIAVSETMGPLILYSDSLDLFQQTIARLMALTAVVRNHATYAVIKMEDLNKVCQLAA